MEKTLNMSRISKPEPNNVSFAQTLCPGNSLDPKLFGIISSKALKNDERLENLYVTYSSEYTKPDDASSS